jgi:hypothetical protein
MRQQRPQQCLLAAAALLLFCVLAITAANHTTAVWAHVLLLIVCAVALLAALASAWPAVYTAVRRAGPYAPAVMRRPAKSGTSPAGRARRWLPDVLPDRPSAVAPGEVPEGEIDATGGTPPLHAAAALEGDFSCIARARDLVAGFLSRVRADCGLPVSERAMDGAQLVVSELVTNARKYAPPRARSAGASCCRRKAGSGRGGQRSVPAPGAGCGTRPGRPARPGDRHGRRPEFRGTPRAGR